MKAYGLKNKISWADRKVASHVRKGDSCYLCNNYKIIKGSARQKARMEIRNSL